jgi:hypothetical protein
MIGGPTPIAAALDYVGRGWPVLPLAWPVETGAAARCSCGRECGRIGKHPHGLLVEFGLKQATVDASTVRQWWGAVPRANVGIVLGELAGMFAIDVDPKSGGDTTLVDLVLAHGPLVNGSALTLAASTGSGGDHFFYRWPGHRVTGVAGTLSQQTKGGFGPGVDVRGDDGYVVAAPSLHASGERYAWSDGEEALDAPRWILDRVLPRPLASTSSPTPWPTTTIGAEMVTRAARYVAAMPPSIAGAGGHQACFAAAVALVRGFALDEGVALALLEREFNPACKPRWSRRELEHKIASAARASVPSGYLRAGRPRP